MPQRARSHSGRKGTLPRGTLRLLTRPKFIPGMELNRSFFFEVVEPLMQEHFPDLSYSAGLVGHGSDVLGFDTRISLDHDWGPHLQLFLSELDFIAQKDAVDQILRKHLPYAYRGFSTNFEEGSHYLKHVPKPKKSGEVNHLFSFWTARSFFDHYLGFDIDRRPSFRDWLLFPQQALLEATGGALFRDDLDIAKFRRMFAYYPDDVWKYMLRVQWGKISDELHTSARSGEAGDPVGSRLIAARNVHKIMFLCFLMERKYAPYPKWFGSAFERWLDTGPELYPLLDRILTEASWRRRQSLLARAYQRLGEMHNDLGITPPLSTEVVFFEERGYRVLKVEDYIEAIEKSIRNPLLRDMRFPLGGIDQFIDHPRISHINYVYRELQDIIQ